MATKRVYVNGRMDTYNDRGQLCWRGGYNPEFRRAQINEHAELTENPRNMDEQSRIEYKKWRAYIG